MYICRGIKGGEKLHAEASINSPWAAPLLLQQSLYAEMLWASLASIPMMTVHACLHA